jgi:hypothetical protein
MYEPSMAPSDTRKPGAGTNDRRSTLRHRHRGRPPAEPTRRRVWVEIHRSAKVLSEIVEHVDEGVAHLTRRAEHTRVVAVAPDAASATERAIHRLCDTNCEPLDTADEPRRLVCFYNQMQMVSLNAERQKTKAIGARG